MRSPYLFLFAFILIVASTRTEAQQAQGTLVVEVHSGLRPVEQAEVIAGDRVAISDERGEAVLQLPAGDVDVTIQRYGLKSQVIRVSIVESTTSRVTVELEAEAVIKEEITVTATRAEVRIEDVPLRVEVVNQEEIEEKALMTPGDIAMLLNETSGLRVQVTSPSLGAANVRVQGLRGRYTQLLADGLPLYGGQTGAIGLLQIPPLDLGQVEVIKGVASAFYGSSALGGVINLISRRAKVQEREFLLNRTSRGGTDGVFWLAEPLQERWRYTMLGGAHIQESQDIDRDGWADMPGYRRVVLRPRFFWDDGSGRSVFATIGGMVEDREGGTIGDARAPDGQRFPEELRTRRLDGGVVGRFAAGQKIVSLRGSVMTQRHRHRFGQVVEHDRHETLFGEAAISGTNADHTWTLGSALQADLYRARELSRFNYTYTVPAIFAQDEYSFGSRLTLSGSGRVDFHSDYGTFLNPRISALIRLPKQWTARFSTGTGVFAPTPFTEETEAVGLSRLLPLSNLKAERAWSASADLGWSTSRVELNGSLFGSVIRNAIMLRPVAPDGGLQIFNAGGPSRTMGSELLARFRAGDFGLVLTHTFVHSTEIDPLEPERRLVPLTPQNTAGLVGTWEKEGRSRIGIELFYTGKQRLDNNPFREESRPYWVIGMLVERRVGFVRLFLNAENITNIRQTRYDPLVRRNRHFDGSWTVDAWAPLEGRVINGGLRISF
ncbi:MAG: TonB-dependent receptor [Acidobacteria bacterium]|nr:TonB-dependent receptor [Acidobacteriota bacterium]